MAQEEHLKENQKELEKAYKRIEDQKGWLEEEIVIYDYEITQFSYNVCHHIRGPVASLSGLINLATVDKNIPIEDIFTHVKKSVNQLDNVISDLNHILTVRKDIFRSKSYVSLEILLAEVEDLLYEERRHSHPTIIFEASNLPPVFVSHSAMVNILYNLLANAIKYRN